MRNKMDFYARRPLHECADLFLRIEIANTTMTRLKLHRIAAQNSSTRGEREWASQVVELLGAKYMIPENSDFLIGDFGQFHSGLSLAAPWNGFSLMVTSSVRWLLKGVY